MKKLLVGTAAVALGLALATPAKADGVKLGVGGYFKGYTAWIDQDEAAGGPEARNFDILRDTEVHFTGETTLDNGLTVGFHTELEDDDGDGFAVDESYAYFSGAWGRVNFGAEDGAAYLLQVAAPSADSNYDGLRQFINPVNYALAGFPGIAALDYAQDVTASADKFTYLTPVFSGFQGGLSYTPDLGASLFGDTGAGPGSRQFGVAADDEEDELGNAWDVAGRWEGMLGDFGLAVGGGWTHADVEEDTDDTSEEQDAYNVGLDVNWGAFGVGAAYTHDDNAVDDDGDTATWVIGGDYTTGPYKIGVSYLNREDEENAPAGGLVGDELDTDRITGGVVYTYGPGMTFRGSVSFLNHDVDGGDDFDSTHALIGTQIDF